MRIKTLRLPPDLFDEITRRARMKGVPDADYYRLLIERGLLLESVEIAMEKSLPPAYWGLCEAVLETRNILRSLAAAREHSTIPKAQVQATSRQTPRVWSDAIPGSEILANWFKLGTNSVVLWLSIGMILGGTIGAFWL